MTVEHVGVERLSALIDGLVPPTQLGETERHLATCAACRAELAQLRALLGRAATLRRELEPPPESWAIIRRRLRPHGQLRRTAARWGSGWVLRAAAALVLVAGSSVLTAVALRSKYATPPASSAQPTALPAAVRSIDETYAGAVDELTTSLREQRGALAPATVVTLQRTLRIIDDAIAEARAALAIDPANRALVDVLSANYEKKVELLRRASELPART